MSRNMCRCVGVIVVFTVAFFATVELCARIDDAMKYGAPLCRQYTHNILRGRGENVPNVRFEKWRHNSLGFRGPEIAQEKRAGTTRVVCLGASESYGLYESPDKEWPSQMRELLPASYEVVNASVPGLGLRSFYRYMDKHVLPLKPDLVVLVLNPLFYVSGLERAAVNTQQSQPVTNPVSAPSSLSPVGGLRILPKMKQAVKQCASAYIPDLLQKYQVYRLKNELAQIESLRLKGKSPRNEVPKAYLDTFRKDLVATIKLIRAGGSEAVLTSYPSLIGPGTIAMHPEIFLDNRKFCIELSLRGMSDCFGRFNDVIAEVARDEGTSFVDSAAEMPKDLRFFADNVHYTDKGARIFAERVAEKLLRVRRGPSQIASYTVQKEKQP